MGSLTVTMITPLSSLLVCVLLLSPGLAQRRLRNSLMTGRFLYKAQPEDLEMWTKYLELHSVPLTEESLSQDSYGTTFTLSPDGNKLTISIFWMYYPLHNSVMSIAVWNLRIVVVEFDGFSCPILVFYDVIPVLYYTTILNMAGIGPNSSPSNIQSKTDFMNTCV